MTVLMKKIHAQVMAEIKKSNSKYKAAVVALKRKVIVQERVRMGHFEPGNVAPRSLHTVE